MGKKYLLTAALPYANGPLHFGHLVGAYIPGDITSRHHRIKGDTVKYICGSDEHGVAITLSAKKANLDYQKYVDGWCRSHRDLFKRFQIDFDFYGQTSAHYHREEVIQWFKAIYEKGFIKTQEEQQLFCNDCKNHLPDRYVEGKCYSCGYEKARGDECPKCGLWIESQKLIDPVCQICKSQNVKEVTVSQYYLLLSEYHKEFRQWFEKTTFNGRKGVYPFVDSLSKEELTDRAITRDLDWGINVPLEEEKAQGKRLYVWFDAPIGYVSNLKKHLEEEGSSEHYLDDWFRGRDVSVEHFIGKDNIIFHCIIFPIMGMISGRTNPPHDVVANQHLNLAGKQFSKSEGWYIDIEEALNEFGADNLRYYLTAIMPENSDASFVWQDFAAKINGELANNIGNLVARCLKFWAKNWPEGLPPESFANFTSSPLAKDFSKKIEEHSMLLDRRQFKKGLEKVMAMGQLANNFFSEREPWSTLKTDSPNGLKVTEETIAHTGLLIIILGVMLSPYLPGLSERILNLFGEVNDEVKRGIYEGKLDILDILVGQGPFKLAKAPGILVPKIEKAAIKKWEERLMA